MRGPTWQGLSFEESIETEGVAAGAMRCFHARTEIPEGQAMLLAHLCKVKHNRPPNSRPQWKGTVAWFVISQKHMQTKEGGKQGRKEGRREGRKEGSRHTPHQRLRVFECHEQVATQCFCRGAAVSACPRAPSAPPRPGPSSAVVVTRRQDRVCVCVCVRVRVRVRVRVCE